MKFRIFGRNSDDKGTQLENLTRHLLTHLGYTEIALNVISTGGNEIDIQAQYPLPGPAGTETLKIIGECKAHETALNTTDWLKFLGKVYTAEAGNRTDIRGVLIALGGINGNVKGAYDDLRSKRTNISVVTGDILRDLVLAEFTLPTVDKVSTFLRAVVPIPFTEIALGYYMGMAFWTVQFSDGSFTLLSGASLDAPIPVTYLEVVKQELATTVFRDPRAEAEAKVRARNAEQLILSCLLIEGHKTVPQLFARVNEMSGNLTLTDPELNAALDCLQHKELTVRQQPDEVTLGDVEGDVDLRHAFFLHLTDGSTIVYPWGTDAIIRLVDTVLLQKILDVQHGLNLTDTEKDKVLFILRSSPTSVAWAIRPDPMITPRRGNDELIEMLTPNRTRYFLARLLEHFVMDFKNPKLASLFFERLEFREVELHNSAILKSSTRAEREFEVTERYAIGRVAPEMGGGLLNIWLLASAPEPWQMPDPDA